MPGTSRYVHGTHPEEQQRLADLNALLNARSLAALAPHRGERMLDLGSGLGQFAREVARATGERVLGVERSAEQIARAEALAHEAGEAAGVEFRAGDAAAPPLRSDEWGTFDIAHARFLLEHVPDPGAVVAVMQRAVRSGGRVVLEDDDHATFQPWPEPEGFAALWGAYQAGYTRAGNDPRVGVRLVELLAGAGLRPRRIAQLEFGGCAGQPEFAALAANLIAVLEGAHAAQVGHGLTESRYASAMAALAAWSERPDAALWYTVRWAEGVRA